MFNERVFASFKECGRIYSRPKSCDIYNDNGPTIIRYDHPKMKVLVFSLSEQEACAHPDLR